MKRSIALRWASGAAVAVASAAVTLTVALPQASAADGPNLSLSAGADGSSKAGGTSYGNVRDGNLSTHWSPAGATGSVSVKWGSPVSVSRAVVRESAGSEGAVTAWRRLNHDTGAVLASGSRAGAVTFARTSLSKITCEITGSSGTPRVAEFETYAS